MFNVGAGEMFVIMLLALIVLGPERLPKAMGQVGRTVAQLRRISGGFQDEIRRAMDPDSAPFRPGEESLDAPRPAVEDEVKVVNAGGGDAAAPTREEGAVPGADAHDEGVDGPTPEDGDGDLRATG